VGGGLWTVRRFPKRLVCVIEKEGFVGAHQSSHNSGVIHAGMYYPVGSAMANTCVEGAALLYEFCKEHDVLHDRVGKLIVASNLEEHDTVSLLYARGIANGVKGLEILNQDQIKALEPNVRGHSALYSPNTGIVDFADVCRVLARLVQSHEGDVITNFCVDKIDPISTASGRSEVLIHGKELGQLGPQKEVHAKYVISCCGLQSDFIGSKNGGSKDPKIVPFRGTYYQMKPEYKDIVKMNVYPVPTSGGIPVGVHFTPYLSRDRGYQVIVGPGACMSFAREGYSFFDINFGDVLVNMMNPGLWRFVIKNFDLAFGELYRDLNKKAFLKSARKLIPDLKEDMTEESFSGVMAQVFHSNGKTAEDYIIERGALGGTTMHLRNAPSPAATASLAIGRKLIEIGSQDFNWSSTH